MPAHHDHLTALTPRLFCLALDVGIVTIIPDHQDRLISALVRFDAV